MHSIHPETILDEARHSYFYSMPSDPRQAALAAANALELVDAGILERWATNPARMLTREELLSGRGANATIGLRLVREPVLSMEFDAGRWVSRWR